MRTLRKATAALRLHPIALALTLLPGALAAQTLPNGLSVVRGQASVRTTGNAMTVTNSDRAILNWQSFSIGAQNAVRFEQPSASSQVLNRVLGNDPSSILGSLSSNGKVWLLNPNGVLFGQGARVDVAGLVASTLNLNDLDWLAGRYAFFNPGSRDASVANSGRLRTLSGGQVMLVGGNVSNDGLIEAPGGQVVLAAGHSVELADSNAPTLTVRVQAPAGSALNLGQVLAPGGRIDLAAAMVSQQGIVRADAIASGAGGEVMLKASGAIDLASGSVTSAGGASGGSVTVDAGRGTTLVAGEVSATGSTGTGGAVRLLGRQVGVLNHAVIDVSGAAGGGEIIAGGGARGQDARVANARAAYIGPQARLLADATSRGDGGRILVWSDDATRAYGHFSARGGPQGGDGGLIETSGGWLDARPASVQTSAPKGKPGVWLLDPNDITISDTGPDTNITGSPDFTTTDDSAVLTTRSIVDALNAGNNVSITTGSAFGQSQSGNTQFGDIRMVSATIDAAPASAVTLTLNAQRDIDIVGSRISSSNGALGISLNAGGSFEGGVISIRDSTLLTRGGQIDLGGASAPCGPNVCTDGPTGAFGDDRRGTGIEIANSTLDAGSGGITARGYSLAGSNAPAFGIRVDASSTLQAADIDLFGWVDSNGTLDRVGIQIAGRLQSTGAILLDGSSNTSNSSAPTRPWGVELSGGTLAAAGIVQVSADNVHLGSGSTVTSTATGDAIEFAGNGGHVSSSGCCTLSALIDIPLQAFAAVSGFNLSAFINDAGAALSAPNGRWLVYATDPSDSANFVAGGLPYAFKQYDAVFGTATPAQADNGLLFSIAPTLSRGAGVSPIAKTYDSTTEVIVSGLGQISGEINGDRVIGQFADKNAGVGKPITVFDSNAQARALDTQDKPVYGYAASASDTFTLTGNIDQAPITLLNPLFANKTYDGSRAAQLTSVDITGLIGSEQLGLSHSYQFDTKDAGTGKTVSGTTTLLDGANGGLASNYALVNPDLSGTATIFQRPITAGAATAASKVYDRTTSASVSPGTLTGLVPGESLGVSASGSFRDANAGTAKPVDVTMTISDTATGSATNYRLDNSQQVASADIRARAVQLGTPSVADKVYDTTTNAAVTALPLVGVLTGDTVATSVASASFDTADAGQAKRVSVQSGALTGADAANYDLSSRQAEGTANIAKAPLTYVATPTTVLAGATLPPLSGTVTGFLGQETPASATTGTLAFTSPATPQSPPGRYAILGSGLAAGNYDFIQADVNATALAIEALPVRIGSEDVKQELTRVIQSVDLEARNLPSRGRVLDVLPALVPGNVLAYGRLPVADMSMRSLEVLLAARDELKRELFAEAIAELERAPSLPDLPPCETPEQVESGRCLITETLKAQLAGPGITTAKAPAPQALAPAPAAPTAPAAQATPPQAAPQGAAPATAAPATRIVPLFPPRAVRNAALPKIARKLAVTIGTDRYADTRIPQLDNAVSDAKAVASLLERSLGYETLVIENGTKERIVATLNKLALEAAPADSVVVYYAGHGAVVESTGLGYWQPANADASHAETWLSNRDIGKLIAQIGATQVALISDSCYSGSLVAEERVRATVASLDPNQVLSRKAVVVMSSGGNEPVFDSGKDGHSPFAFNLMRNLQQVSSWQPGGSVFERVRFAVARELPQRPQYGTSPSAGHQPGTDYLFEKRQLDESR